MALGCQASAIIYQNTRVYGDCQLIIAINASARQLTVQPNATPNIYGKNEGWAYLLGVALGCRASAIIYQNTRVYGDYQLIIAINASTRQLTVEPNATSSNYGSHG